MLKNPCFARTCFGICTIQLAIKKKYSTVVYLHMTLSYFFQRCYISGTMQNMYCCAYFRLLSVHLRLLQDLLPILEKVVQGIPLPRYWIINESNLEIILDKMKDHKDNLDSMAQLEVIPTPAKTDEELEHNLAAIKVCGYNTGSVK